MDSSTEEPFNGTLIEPLSGDLKNLISVAADRNNFNKKVQCYDNHHALDLACQLACQYCGKNTSIWHCHPYCAECICNGPEQECSSCVEFQQKQKDMSEHRHGYAYWTDNKRMLNEVTYVNRMLNLSSDGKYTKYECPLCFNHVIPGGDYCVFERYGNYIRNCTKCNTYGYTKAIGMSNDTFLCDFCIGHCIICKDFDYAGCEVTHETFFGPKQFKVCRECIDKNELNVFDSSISTIVKNDNYFNNHF